MRAVGLVERLYIAQRPMRKCVNCGREFVAGTGRECFYCHKPLCTDFCGVEHVAGAQVDPRTWVVTTLPEKAPCCGHENCPKWSDFARSDKKQFGEQK